MELSLVEVLFFIVTLQGIISQVTEEIQGQLMLPFLHKLNKVLQVFISAVLVIYNILLFALVPFIRLDKFLHVFWIVSDSKVRLTLVLYLIELIFVFIQLGLSELLFWCDILASSVPLISLNFLGLSRVTDVFVFRFLELIKHVVSGEPLYHRHELLDLCCDTFAVKNCHQVVDERFLVWKSDIFFHTPVLKL